MHRYLLLPVLLFTLVLAGGPALAGGPVDLPAWAAGEPELHVSLDGSRLLLLHRAAVTGEPDWPAAAMMLAEQRNPGLIASFGARVFAAWLDEGIVAPGPDGGISFSRDRLPALEARLRLAVALDLAPYLRRILEAADPGTLEALALGLTSPSPADVADLPPFEAEWFVPGGHTMATEWRDVECEPCSEDDGSVFCPHGQCVSDCDGDGHVCVEENVPLPSLDVLRRMAH